MKRVKNKIKIIKRASLDEVICVLCLNYLERYR